MENKAESVIRVCATSKCVRFGRRGRRVVKIDEGRMVHSWRLSLVTGRAVGKLGEATAAVKESWNLVEEQAQRSSPFSFGRSHKSLLMTLISNSSSICSCAKNSLKFGVKFKHCKRVAGIKFKVCWRSRAVCPPPVGL